MAGHHQELLVCKDRAEEGAGLRHPLLPGSLPSSLTA